LAHGVNFVKADAVIDVLDSTCKVVQKIVRTGQHYDPKISEVFLQELEFQSRISNLQGANQGGCECDNARGN
jgi:UDP-N-acetylglucosamine 2-epimerase